METRSVEYAGQSFEVDAEALRSWRIVKGLTTGGAQAFDSLDRLFLGRSDEYAERLGDDFEAMMALANKAAEELGAKNS